ncbi:helix-turn-helix transcriptional regulator [Phenylobacterium sp.]|uniref:helix-turn-helix transcriptional regulator n=1 Tax=Phenylobacterium sp. TaxID=1871053 RepID=UPI00301C4FC7
MHPIEGEFAAARSELIEAVYAAATDADRWRDFVDAVSNRFGGHTSLYIAERADRSENRLLTANYDPEFVSSYNARYCALNPLIVDLSYGASAVQFGEDYLTEAELRRTEFHADWLAPQDLEHGLTCFMHAAGSRGVNLGVMRSSTRGPGTEIERAFLTGLRSHLKRSIDIALRLGSIEAGSRASAALLESLALGVLLADESGRVVFMNDPAERLLTEIGALQAPAGRVRLNPAAQKGRLAAAVAAACVRDGSSVAVGNTLFLSRDEGRSPLAVLVAPFRGAVAEFTMDDGLALVVVSDPDGRSGPLAQRLRDRFGLTNAEARLAVALCSGLAVGEYAEKAGISPLTARAHLRALFAKTRCVRQAELVVKLLNEPLLQVASLAR